MKKGFTLIELLAVIAILAIVLLIAVPKIIDIINNVKNNAFLKDEDMMVAATRNYLAANQSLIPNNIGDTIEVTLSDLQTNNFITTIKNPKGSNDCNGYIIITKLDDASYNYNPQLNCINNIGSIAADGLKGHWNFNDFQEPTTNLSTLALDGMNNIQYSYIGNENSYRKYSISGTWNSGTYPYSFNLGPYNYTAGISYSVSANIYTNVPEKFIAFGTINIVNDGAMTGARRVIRSDDYTAREDYIHSVNMGNAAYLTSQPLANGTTFNPATDFLYVKTVQIEAKSYSTPYTPNTRSGIIKDYSGNGNSATLQLATTPKWIANSRNNTGAYEFNGSNNFIDYGNKSDFNLTNVGTVMLWAKPSMAYPSSTTSTNFRGLIAKTIGGGSGQQSYWIDWMGTNSTRTLRAGIGDSVALTAISVDNYNFNNEWRHIAFVWNGSNLILYSNGVEIGRIAQNRNAQIITNSLEVGRAFSGAYWSGLLDEVRLYSRALSVEEIYQIYISESLR